MLQNDGLAVKQQSAFAKQQLEVRLSISERLGQVEAALARGGADPSGADVAIVPLPELVASYETIKALDPVMFLIVGWSSGRDVLFSKFGSIAELAKQDPLTLHATPGSSETFLGAFALDTVGADLSKLELEASDVEKPDPSVWAVERKKLDGIAKNYQGQVLLSTAEALHLIPYVAVAQRSLVRQHPQALVTLAKVWFEGQARVTQDPTSAARRLAKLDGGPEPLALLGQLGEMSMSSIKDNALSAGVAGRGAVNLGSLFQRCWRYWRTLKVLTTPPPELAPVSGEVIAQLVLSEGPDAGPRGSHPLPTADALPTDEAEPLMVLAAAPKEKLDRAVQQVGFVAGVFARSRLRFTAYTGASYDKKSTEALVQQVTERFGLSERRLVPYSKPPTSLSSYRLEVMPVQ